MPAVELLRDPLGAALAAGLLGLVVGSFLNVVIVRLPQMLQSSWRRECRQYLELPGEEQSERFNLLVPRSRCPHCGHEIAWWENVPVLSYLFLRGRCSDCGAGISLRYPLVEVATALLSAAVAWQFGATWVTLAALLLTWALVALTAIDFEHQLLPDGIVLPMLWLGLVLSLFTLFTGPGSSILGAVFGYLTLWSIYWVFKLLTGKEGMGYGDFKLLALLGAWLGWQMLPLVILLSSLVGAVVGISLMALRRHERGTPMPFGPYLAGGGWIALLWGPQLTAMYLGG